MTAPTPTTAAAAERCALRHPGMDVQCGLPKGHRGEHTTEIPDTMPWAGKDLERWFRDLEDDNWGDAVEAFRAALLAARRDADRYRVLRTDAVLDGQFENDAAFDAWADPKLPSLGQEWVSRVTASDGPDVFGSDGESRRAYFARIGAECNEIRSQLLAARRENETLRKALTAIANLNSYRDPAYPHIWITELPSIARAALAATQEEK